DGMTGLCDKPRVGRRQQRLDKRAVAACKRAFAELLATRRPVAVVVVHIHDRGTGIARVSDHPAHCVDRPGHRPLQGRGVTVSVAVEDIDDYQRGSFGSVPRAHLPRFRPATATVLTSSRATWADARR